MCAYSKDSPNEQQLTRTAKLHGKIQYTPFLPYKQRLASNRK